MHIPIEPSILYFGTPVILITTLNEDGSTNIAPVSSVWWLCWSCMLGLDPTSKTTENLKRSKECVLNLASDQIVDRVDRLALLTGSESVPLHKKMLGYRYCSDKFTASGLTPIDSKNVKPKRIKECPIQLEAKVSDIYPLGKNDPRMAVPACSVELSISMVHAESYLLEEGSNCRIDPDKWRPLIMNFRRFYGLTSEIHPSKLGVGPEETYAPWKQGMLKRAVTNAIVKVAYRKYRIN